MCTTQHAHAQAHCVCLLASSCLNTSQARPVTHAQHTHMQAHCLFFITAYSCFTPHRPVTHAWHALCGRISYGTMHATHAQHTHTCKLTAFFYYCLLMPHTSQASDTCVARSVAESAMAQRMRPYRSRCARSTVGVMEWNE